MTSHRRSPPRPAARVLSVIAAALLGAGVWSPAAAQVPLLADPSPSDPRATFVSGNVVTCAGAGFPDAIQIGAIGSASDPHVTGTVGPNTGTIQPGQGEEVNVAVGPGVVVDAVVVKGGPAHNVYSDVAVVPPAAAPPQHYIAPFNAGGNVPEISHWFVCYHLVDPEPTGSLTVEKAVLAPDGTPVEPLPTTYTVTVRCDDGIHTEVTVQFGVGSGRGTSSQTLTGIPIGTTCTVVEEGTDGLPAGAEVRYQPPTAPTTGVTIDATTGVVVDVVNDFSGVEVERAILAVAKVVQAAPGTELPDSYTARVVCDDGTDEHVSLPAAGGPGDHTVSVRTPTHCAVGELLGSLPPGWTVTYTVAGGEPSPTPRPFLVEGTTDVGVTITNRAPDAPTPTDPTDPGTPIPSDVASGGLTGNPPGGAGSDGSTGNYSTGELARTGPSTIPLLVLGLAALVTGALLTSRARRRIG